MGLVTRQNPVEFEGVYTVVDWGEREADVERETMTEGDGRWK